MALTQSYAAAAAAARESLSSAVSEARKLAAGDQAAELQDWEAAIGLFSAGLSIEGTDDEALASTLSSRLDDARAAKRSFDKELREAKNEAAALYSRSGQQSHY